mgnify:CR=1 FL=1
MKNDILKIINAFNLTAEQFEKLTVCGIPGPEYTKMIFDKIWTSAK